MSDKQVTTKGNGEGQPPTTPERAHSFYALQRRMNEMFEDFWRGWPMPSFDIPGMGLGKFAPKVNVEDDGKAIRIHAELPGMEEKDIEVTVQNGNLSLRGERTEEKETKEGEEYVRERWSGSFSRTLNLPTDVNTEKINASFKNGVLEVHLPKTKQAEGKRIEVKAA